MPYTDTTTDIVRVTAAAVYPNGQVQETSYHLQCVTAGASNSLPAICNFMDSMMTSRMLPYLASTVTYHGSRCYLVKSFAKFVPTVTHISAAGTAPDDSLPTQVRSLLEWKSDFARPAGIGRMFLFTPTVLQQGADNHPLPAYVTAMDAMAAQLQNGYTGGGSVWQPVIPHRSKTKPTTYTVSTITGRLMSQRWATQRRAGDRGRLNVLPW